MLINDAEKHIILNAAGRQTQCRTERQHTKQVHCSSTDCGKNAEKIGPIAFQKKFKKS